MIKKRGFFICIENVEVNSLSSFSDKLKAALKCPLRVMKIDDMPEEKEEEIKEIESKNEKMGKRAKHMLYGMERWKKREEILKELDKGTTIIVLDYCFAKISESVCEDLEYQWGKSQFTGLVRPDRVFYYELKEEVITKFFGNFKYMVQLKDKEENKVVEDVKAGYNELNKIYTKSGVDDFTKNFYPSSIGEDLFMYQDI